MTLNLALYVGFVSLLCCVKRANKFALVASFYGGLPFFASCIPSGAEKARGIVRPRPPTILRIGCVINIAQVCYRVVRSVAVSVVNKFGRPLPIVHKPSQSVGQVLLFPNGDAPISAGLSASGNAAIALPSGAWINPVKNAGQWVVGEPFARLLRGKIFVSHDAVPSQIGQKPVTVDAITGFAILRLITKKAHRQGVGSYSIDKQG